MLKKNLSHIQRFPEFAHISDIDELGLIPPKENNLPLDPLMCEIFAPDPVTGVPCSDLHIIMSRDARPEVAQFIRDKMMQPLGKVEGLGDGEDDYILDTVKSRGESLQDYGNRLREIVEKYNKPEIKDKD